MAGRYTDSKSYPEGSRAARGEWFAQRVNQRGIEVAVKLAEMAVERELTVAQLALLWVKDQPGITSPIVGPRTLDHLEQALGILEVNLDEADIPLFNELVHPGNAGTDFHDSNSWMKARILE